MSTGFLRKPWVWVLIAIVAVVILFTFLPSGRSEVDTTLRAFTENATEGLVVRVEVDDNEIDYKLIGDDRTFTTKMEEGDTVRQILQDAGIDPADHPAIEVKEPSFASRIPGLIVAFLPIIVFVGLLYFVLRAALGATGRRTKDIDPVCGKRVGSTDAAGSSTFQDVSYRFCSSDCKHEFDANPVRHLLKK